MVWERRRHVSKTWHGTSKSLNRLGEVRIGDLVGPFVRIRCCVVELFFAVLVADVAARFGPNADVRFPHWTTLAGQPGEGGALPIRFGIFQQWNQRATVQRSCNLQIAELIQRWIEIQQRDEPPADPAGRRDAGARMVSRTCVASSQSVAFCQWCFSPK